MAIGRTSSKTSNTSNSNTNSNMSTAALMMEWFDNHCGVDLLGCDDSCAAATQHVLTQAMPRHSLSPPLQSTNQAERHDALLEALLHEQSQSLQHDEDSSTVSGTIEASSSTASADGKRKRRRPVRLTRRRTPPRIGRVSSQNLDSSSTSSTVAFPLAESIATKPVEDFVHPHCRMQKDKGRGEAVGSVVCAKGRDQCLTKLRQKMRLLAEHANGGKATMKRKKARVSAIHPNFCETRSLLELRMGFLSMQYGVLLRWDEKGTVTLVVLRKMCHDSFYPKKNLTAPTTKHQVHQPTKSHPTIISPPPRSPDRHTGQLQIACPTATGLSRRANWTLQLAYQDCLENFIFKEDCGVLRCTQTLKQRVENTHNLSPLEIKLFEQRPRRRTPRRLVSSMQIPLSGLKAQPQWGKPSRLQLPFSHDQDAVLQLELWLLADPPPPRTPSPAVPRPIVFEQEELEHEPDDPWEFLCCVFC